jgi:N-acetylmuramoyl-L-alanine amidase CwlA
MIENGLIKDKINGLDVIIDLIPVSNTTSRPQYYMKPEYITIHNTGNSRSGANAEMHTNYVDTATGYVSWHFTVDDKAIYQELPITENGWHAGDGNGDGNRKSIGIEICENIDGDYDKAEENAIALIRYLMQECNIDIDHVVPHQHWSGKYCPHVILDYGWDKFIKKIKGGDEMAEQEVSNWAEVAQQWVIDNKISDGTRPKDAVTREEVWAMLYRANK